MKIFIFQKSKSRLGMEFRDYFGSKILIYLISSAAANAAIAEGLSAFTAYSKV